MMEPEPYTPTVFVGTIIHLKAPGDGPCAVMMPVDAQHAYHFTTDKRPVMAPRPLDIEMAISMKMVHLPSECGVSRGWPL
jgi:hypothetical protein